MSDEQPAVYEIDLSKKYILQFEKPLPMAELERIRDEYKRWITSDEPILILFGKIKLVKVESDDE